MRWANVQAADVKFSQDSTHQKSLKSVNFRESYLKNEKVDVLGTPCIFAVIVVLVNGPRHTQATGLVAVACY